MSLQHKKCSFYLCTTLLITSVWPHYVNANSVNAKNINTKNKVYYLSIKNHIFIPAVLTIPANKKVKIIIENQDDVAEEFDSFDLNREKVIFAGKKSTLYVGPLPAGKYEYFGEFHPNTARGKIIVVENKQ